MAGYGKVTAPRRWQSSPDSPPTQLAYVTQPEIDLLVDADIHGSLKRGPNRGPQGIMSLDGGGGSYWGGSSGSGSSGSGSSGGGGGGHGLHWDPPAPVVTVPPPWVADPAPIVNIPDPVIETGPPPGEPGGPGYVAPPPPVEVWDEEDIDYLDGELVSGMTPDEITEIVGDPYTPSEDIYPWLEGGTPTESENLVNVSQVGGGPNNPGSLLYGIDLESYGLDPKSEFLPKDFLDMLFEGSVVTGGEDVITEDLIASGENWPNYIDSEGNWVEGAAPDTIINPVTGEVGSTVGTWIDVEAGTHPLFPGGVEDYYDPYGNLGDAWHDPSGGPSVPEQVQRYGERRPSLAEFARNFWFSESLGDVEEKEARREAEGLGPATMSNMDRMFAKNFAAEAMGPDPFYDKDFSSKYYEDYDPIYAGMDLFERARS